MLSQKYSRAGVTITIVCDQRRVKGNDKYPVKLCVCLNRKQRYFPTGIALSLEEWGTIHNSKKSDLIKVRNQIIQAFQKMEHHVDDLLDKWIFDFLLLGTRRKSSSEPSVTESFQAKIAKLQEEEAFTTANSYRIALHSFEDYFGNTIRYSDISIESLKAYEKKMIANEKSYTTVGIYMRCLRTILNEAIRTGFLEASAYPFGRGKYEIPVSEGRKMALKLSQIKEILDYPDTSEAMQEYRDLWLFSYLCNGANFNDILRLKYENIKGEEICFYRGKTLHTSKKKKEIMVYLTPPMEAIIKKWGNQPALPSKYIFRFLNGCSDPKKSRDIITDVIKRTNHQMKKISKALNLPPVTTYTARHSYATVLKRSGANIAFISESLGHSDLKTTENYLASFETEERKKNADLLTAF